MKLHIPPTDAQLELRFEDQRATVMRRGAGVRTYEVAGSPVLSGYPMGGSLIDARGAWLVPWPGQLADGEYEFRGRRYRLRGARAGRASMHGLAMTREWAVRTHDERRAVLTTVLGDDPGYPFMVNLQVTWQLARDGLAGTITATNVGDEPAPYGVGAHPYVDVGAGTVDDAVLELPAHSAVSVDEEAAVRPLRDEESYHPARRIGGSRLGLYTDLVRGADGRARVVVADPATGRQVCVWMDESFRYARLRAIHLTGLA